ncbi:MAG TPA: glycosyltransferase family 39 protein [Polyangiaceae bacterium]|jgi:hypothetical protein
MTLAPRSDRVAVTALVAVSAVLCGVRLWAAREVGFGDSEALYAAYALHPQPAYLDHPGLVGVLARAIGGGSAPTPAQAHAVTTVLATVLPWLMALVCRVSGASWGRAAAAALVFALAPEIAVGLFAMTPDLCLALAWTLGLLLAAAALREPPGSTRAACAFAGAGVLAGVAVASKVTGVTWMAALAVTYASAPARKHAKTIAPWAGLAAGAVLVVPIAAFEDRLGWPLLRHRLVDTQAAAGLSWRNAGALLGGQLVYLSPVTALLAARALRDAWRARGDAVGRLLLASSVIPLAALVPLCLWSRVAEPHWIAPALLSLVPAAARAPDPPSRRWVTTAAAVAGAMVAAVYAWVLVPPLQRLAGRAYDPRLDIANELRGWPTAVAAVKKEAASLAQVASPARGEIAVVAPHWVLCAQLDAALRGALPVGCDTPIRDDFDDWLPRARWRHADFLVWVTDNRFPDARTPPDYVVVTTRDVTIFREGRAARVFHIALLARRGLG